MNNVAASVRARLLNVAKAQGVDFNQVLVRFALERILYRLSQSEHADRFLLKGALLFALWYDMPHRATRDADLLGFGASDLDSVAQTFRDIAGVPVDDGIVFDPASVVVEEIRKDAGYAGARVLISGELAKARCKTQIDIGFGDAVTPGPVEASLPSLLPDLPPVELRTYPRATVIAEKLEIIVSFGMANTRLKDYFDLYVLAAENTLDPTEIASAIAATFRRRATSLPPTTPLGLTAEYSTVSERTTQWEAFLTKNGLEAPSLAAVVEKIYAYVGEPLGIARRMLDEQEGP